MHTQVECAFVEKVTPSLTDVGEPAPPMLVIPAVFLIQSVAVEYAEEYIVVEPMDNRVRDGVHLLRCWRWQCWLNFK